MYRTILTLMLAAGVLSTVALPATARDTNFQVLPAGTQSPNFTAYSYSGKLMHLSDLKGQVVVLDFWATWCGPCNEAMPHLQDIQTRYANKGVYVLALCVWDTPDNANKWIPNHPQYTFHYAYDASAGGRSGKGLSIPFKVHAIPSTFILDADGIIVDGGTSMDEDEISTAVDTALQRSQRENLQNKQGVENAPALQDGEILLVGTISKSYDAQKGSFELSVTSVESSDGKVHQLASIRTKTVVATTATTIAAQDMSPHVSDLAAGTPVYVAGRDSGVGKSLTARVVQFAQ